MHQTYDERNADLIVNIDGRLVHRDQAGVSPFDSTVQNGDGVWEGLRLRDEPVFSVQHHPEAGPGPHDAAYLFDEFAQLMTGS